MGHVKCLAAAFTHDKERSTACDSKGATALHLAARGGRLECAKWLVTKAGIAPDVTVSCGSVCVCIGRLHITSHCYDLSVCLFQQFAYV